MTYYIYILECSNGSYYTGYTTDIDRRYQEHLAGSAKCKFTRSFPPKRLAACWSITGKSGIAMSLESKIKRLSSAKKRHLSKDPSDLSSFIEIDYNYIVETRK